MRASARGGTARGAAVEWGSEPPGETAARNEVEVGVRSKGRSVGLDRSCLDSLYHRGLSLSRFARLLRPLLSTDDVPLYPRGLGGDGSAANSQLMEFTDAGLRAVAALDDLVDTAELAALPPLPRSTICDTEALVIWCFWKRCAQCARAARCRARGSVPCSESARARWRVLRARAHLRERGAPSARLSSVRSTDFWARRAAAEVAHEHCCAAQERLRGGARTSYGRTH